MLSETSLSLILHVCILGAVFTRILLRPNREPTSRIAWLAVVSALPVLGVLAYLLVGETSIGRRNLKSMRKAIAELPSGLSATAPAAVVPDKYAHLFSVAQSISGFSPVSGNTAELMADSNASIAQMVVDIDKATKQVNLLFYIWLNDKNGTRMAEALIRAAGRGVVCRAMVDGLGSRALLKSELWHKMTASGVHTAVALPLGHRWLRPLQGRLDLRNHRKILVIDGALTFCGSQNCADPEFRVKAKYAPWVDSVIRFKGAVAQQNQLLFATDWMTYTGEELPSIDPEPLLENGGSILAQVVASGPTLRFSAMPEMFESLLFAARDELVISTPYYVPNQSMQGALCAAAYRGVRVTLILPAHNDSQEVKAASRSYYAELLQAGVKIREYVGGLLHSKTLTLDGEISLIGSANLDRRSFELNYENNILLHDPSLTKALRERQQSYIDSARVVSKEQVAHWSLLKRLWNNIVAMLSPIL